MSFFAKKVFYQLFDELRDLKVFANRQKTNAVNLNCSKLEFTFNWDLNLFGVLGRFEMFLVYFDFNINAELLN